MNPWTSVKGRHVGRDNGVVECWSLQIKATVRLMAKGTFIMTIEFQPSNPLNIRTK